jgi:hypothetical protein
MFKIKKNICSGSLTGTYNGIDTDPMLQLDYFYIKEEVNRYRIMGFP